MEGRTIIDYDFKIVLTFGILAASLLLAPIAAQAADFPNRPITLVIPWGAGRSTDITFRALCEAAKEGLGQPVIPENRPGEGGAVGVSSMVG